MDQSEGASVPERPPYLFKPGQSGNPGGRPSKDSLTLTEALRRYGRTKRIVDDDGKRRRAQDALIRKMYRVALAGNVELMKYIIDRLEGRPKMAPEDADTLSTAGVLVLTLPEHQAPSSGDVTVIDVTPTDRASQGLPSGE